MVSGMVLSLVTSISSANSKTDIVGKFVANDNDYKLIKAIQIYSDMTGSECIAEGVDSEEKEITR